MLANALLRYGNAASHLANIVHRMVPIWRDCSARVSVTLVSIPSTNLTRKLPRQLTSAQSSGVIMTRFMEDTISDAEINALRTEQRIAEYLATDPDQMFRNAKPFRYIESE